MSAVVQHPRAVELVERGKLRKQIERAVSRLIAILDELDSDPEAEPVLGAPEQTEVLSWTYGPQTVPGRDQRHWAKGTTDDREAVDEDGGDILDGGDDDRVDGEPSLGAAEGCADQRRWAGGGQGDLENG